MAILSLSFSTIILSLVVAAFQYVLFKVIYRLYFHPLRNIPGPKFAAATWLAEFYYNVTCDGQYYLKIGEWHEKYNSPIIRVTPDEVHFNSPETYDMIYRVGSKYTKDPEFYLKFTGRGASIFTTIPNGTHKSRRAPLAAMFSKRSVDALDGLIQRHTNTIVERLSALEGKGAVEMYRIIRCVSVDTVSEYCFGKPIGLTREEDYGKWFFDMMTALHPGFWVFHHLPVWMVYKITHSAPPTGPLAGMLTMRDRLMEGVNAVKEGSASETKKHRTIFHELRDVEVLQEDGTVRKPNDVELVDEAVTFAIAASETTGMALEMTLLGILSHPEIRENLKRRLTETFPDGKNMPLRQLESIEYLTACIKEGLRLSHGIIGRLPRVVTEEGVEFHGYKLPVGTVVSQCNYHVHRNPSLFPNPNSFNPERWLGPNSTGLDKHLLSFSKGPRACIGLNLAWAELYIIIAGVVRNLDLKIVKGDSEEGKEIMKVEDIKLKDYFSAFQDEGVGLRVAVEGVTQ